MSQSGHVQTGEDCTANLPASVLKWESIRLVFNQAVPGLQWVQPDTLTNITTASSHYDDPAIATVLLYNVATVRNIDPPARTSDPLVDVNNSLLAPQVSNSPIAPLSPALRGYANPQYRCIFKMGDAVTAEVWCDGNSVISLPASSVQVQAFSQPLLLEPRSANLPIQIATVTGLSIVQATVSVAVQWGKGAPVGGPGGMATYTQIGLTSSTNPITFKRPPFARRVVGIGPVGIAGTWGFDLQSGSPLVTPPTLANDIQRSQDIPHAASAFTFTPTALSEGELLSVIWELGVH